MSTKFNRNPNSNFVGAARRRTRGGVPGPGNIAMRFGHVMRIMKKYKPSKGLESPYQYIFPKEEIITENEFPVLV